MVPDGPLVLLGHLLALADRFSAVTAAERSVELGARTLDPEDGDFVLEAVFAEHSV